MPTTILSVDIGTSSLKAGLVDEHGSLQNLAQVVYPATANTGRWDANLWDQALAAACRQLRLDRPSIVSAMVISGHGPTLVPLDQANNPVAPVLFWTNNHGPTIANQPSVFLPKARWFLDHDPQAAKAVWLATCPEYLVARLCGQRWTIIAHEGYVPYYWDVAQCAAYDVNQDWFAPFNYAGHWLGTVHQAAADQFGLPIGLPIFGGGSDFLMSLIGTATITPGLCGDRAGSSEGINVCSTNPIHGPTLQTFPHAVEGLWNVAGVLNQSGMMFEWFRRLTGQATGGYHEMIAAVEALDDPDDLPIFLPNALGGAYRFDKGLFWGLETHHGPAHISRAVIEHLGFSVWNVLKRLAEAGLPVTELRASGGQAKNAGWCQMKADMIGLPILVPAIIDAELSGDAVFGCLGLGIYPDLPTAVTAIVQPSRHYLPDERRRAYFDRRYQTIMELSKKLSTIAQ
jgi:xylulokinase